MAFNREDFKDLYPFASNYIKRNTFNYHYLDEGQGEPVIMIHGNPTWSFYFRNLVKALRNTYRVIVPDHIGCGLSDKPSDQEYRYDLANRVDDLENLVNHLDLTNITLILHDWGGMIGMAFILRNLSKCKRVVLLNTASFLLPKKKSLPRRLWLLRNFRFLGEPLVRGLNLFSWGATHLASAKGLSSRVKMGLRAPYDSWDNRIATIRFVQDIPLQKDDPSYPLAEWVDQHLHNIKHLPTLICWGEKDFVFDRHFLAEWRSRLPNAEVEQFPNAGHYVLEDETDSIIARIHLFLTSTAG